MELTFQTRMTTKILYDYMLHHTYNSPSGIIGGVAGAGFVLGFFATGNYLYLLAGAVLLAYLPISLYISSMKQMQSSPAFREPLSYRLCDEGIQVSQGEQSQLQKWRDIYKVVSTPRSIVIYNTRVNAWIFPRSDMGELTPKVIEMISTHVKPGKVKIRW